jgi:hypothetical protein
MLGMVVAKVEPDPADAGDVGWLLSMANDTCCELDWLPDRYWPI